MIFFGNGKKLGYTFLGQKPGFLKKPGFLDIPRQKPYHNPFRIAIILIARQKPGFCEKPGFLSLSADSNNF